MTIVSVVIPVYNYGKFIRQAVCSALEQTISNLEVIVVDDGSTDHTPGEVSGINDARLRYIYQTNQGMSSARNLGIRHARSDFVAFLDADDYWLPRKLELQLALLEEDKSRGLVYGGYQLVDAEGGLLAIRYPEISQVNLVKRLVLGNIISGSSTTSVVRKECFALVGLFDETIRYAGDWDMWLRIARRYDCAAVQEPVACVRLHNNNLTSVSVLFEKELQAVLDKFYRQPGLDPDLMRLRRKACSKAKLAAASLASKRGKFTRAAVLSAGSLLKNPFDLDASFLFIKSLMRIPVERQIFKSLRKKTKGVAC